MLACIDEVRLPGWNPRYPSPHKRWLRTTGDKAQCHSQWRPKPEDGSAGFLVAEAKLSYCEPLRVWDVWSATTSLAGTEKER